MSHSLVVMRMVDAIRKIAKHDTPWELDDKTALLIIAQLIDQYMEES